MRVIVPVTTIISPIKPSHLLVSDKLPEPIRKAPDVFRSLDGFTPLLEWTPLIRSVEPGSVYNAVYRRTAPVGFDIEYFWSSASCPIMNSIFDLSPILNPVSVLLPADPI